MLAMRCYTSSRKFPFTSVHDPKFYSFSFPELEDHLFFRLPSFLLNRYLALYGFEYFPLFAQSLKLVLTFVSPYLVLYIRLVKLYDNEWMNE